MGSANVYELTEIQCMISVFEMQKNEKLDSFVDFMIQGHRKSYFKCYLLLISTINSCILGSTQV